MLCGLLAAVALFAIMVLILVDGLGRKLLSQSVTGPLELIEILMVVVIFAALPMGPFARLTIPVFSRSSRRWDSTRSGLVC